MEDEYIMYLIINNDLKMGKGKIASQTCHAACKVTRILERYKPTPKYYKDWEKNGEPKIVLKATEEQLNELADEYPANEIDDTWCVTIRDAGRTQIKSNSLTVIAFRPIMRKVVPALIKGLKLL